VLITIIATAGTDDGDVLVTATLKNNPHITGTRVIAVRNQGPKDAFRMIQAANYDAASVTVSTGGTWGFGGNQFGIQVPMLAGSTWTYKNVDFGKRAPREFAVRLALDSNAATNATIEVWADGATTSTGNLLSTVTAGTSGSNATYATYVAAITAQLSGLHDVVLKPSVTVRVNWLGFA
jgi:hypothetical protein